MLRNQETWPQRPKVSTKLLALAPKMIVRLVRQNFPLCNVHCPLTSVKTKWDNISPVDEDQWFKYLLFIFISNFLGNHEYFSQYSTQQIIGDWGELAFFPFSVAYILLADGPLLDILMFTQSFYNIKNPTGSFGCLRVENKRAARIKITLCG